MRPEELVRGQGGGINLKDDVSPVRDFRVLFQQDPHLACGKRRRVKSSKPGT